MATLYPNHSAPSAVTLKPATMMRTRSSNQNPNQLAVNLVPAAPSYCDLSPPVGWTEDEADELIPSPSALLALDESISKQARRAEMIKLNPVGFVQESGQSEQEDGLYSTSDMFYSDGGLPQRAANSRSSGASLPSLLSHLSLDNTFAVSAGQLDDTMAFDLANSVLQYNSRPFNAIDLYGEQKSRGKGKQVVQLNGNETSLHEKRRVGIERQTRTKKSKLNHQFFRSQALLSPPASILSSSPPSSSSSSIMSTPSLSFSASSAPSSSASSICRVSSSPSSSGSKLSSISTPRTKSSPAWWPSVSLSSGEGRFSRFMPRESEWVGDGRGWLDNNASARYSREQQKALLEVSGMSSRNIAGLLPLETAKRPARRRKVKRDSLREDDDDMIVEDPEGDDAEFEHVDRSEIARGTMDLDQEESMSCIGSIAEEEETKQQPVIQPKEALMSVLRMRVGSAGGTTAGAQSGLRFKKWVVWNSWHRKVTAPVPARPASSSLFRSISVSQSVATTAAPIVFDRITSPLFSSPSLSRGSHPTSSSSSSSLSSSTPQRESSLDRRAFSTSPPPTSLRSFPTVASTSPHVARERSSVATRTRRSTSAPPSSPFVYSSHPTQQIAKRAFPPSWGLGLGLSIPAAIEGDASTEQGEATPQREGCLVS